MRLIFLMLAGPSSDVLGGAGLRRTNRMSSSKYGSHAVATSTGSTLPATSTSTSEASPVFYTDLEGFGPENDIIMDEGPGGILTPRRPQHSAKRPVIQSPGSELDAPPKRKQRMTLKADAEPEGGKNVLPPRDPVC